MSDLEVWEAHFARFGIPFTRDEHPHRSDGVPCITLTIPEGEGYTSFVLIARFTPEGQYLTYGVWE